MFKATSKSSKHHCVSLQSGKSMTFREHVTLTLFLVSDTSAWKRLGLNQVCAILAITVQPTSPTRTFPAHLYWSVRMGRSRWACCFDFHERRRTFSSKSCFSKKVYFKLYCKTRILCWAGLVCTKRKVLEAFTAFCWVSYRYVLDSHSCPDKLGRFLIIAVVQQQWKTLRFMWILFENFKWTSHVTGVLTWPRNRARSIVFWNVIRNKR